MVARHEAGHAVVGTAVANLLPGQPRVEVNHRNVFFEILLVSASYSSCFKLEDRTHWLFEP